jgi:hypothetical protein
MILLTSLSRKLEYQQELVILLVQAVNDDFLGKYLIANSKSRKINLNSKIARFSLK